MESRYGNTRQLGISSYLEQNIINITLLQFYNFIEQVLQLAGCVERLLGREAGAKQNLSNVWNWPLVSFMNVSYWNWKSIINLFQHLVTHIFVTTALSKSITLIFNYQKTTRPKGSGGVLLHLLHLRVLVRRYSDLTLSSTFFLQL